MIQKVYSFIYLITIQQVNAVSAIVNGGNLYKPYIVKSFLEPETNSIIKTNNKQFVRKVISAETSELVKYSLESVVSNGTGRTSYVEEYRVGGKTGTAQKVENGRYMDSNYIMSFIATVPADKPEAVLYIALDNPKNVAQLASVTVTPTAKKILIDIINALDIKKDSSGLGKIYQGFERKYYEVPNVVGMKVNEAMLMLRPFQVEFVGSGDTIIEQSPSAKSRVISGGTVRLLVDN